MQETSSQKLQAFIYPPFVIGFNPGEIGGWGLSRKLRLGLTPLIPTPSPETWEGDVTINMTHAEFNIRSASRFYPAQAPSPRPSFPFANAQGKAGEPPSPPLRFGEGGKET